MNPSFPRRGATSLEPLESRIADANTGVAAVGGYPYCTAAPHLCSVGQNHGVEEENA